MKKFSFALLAGSALSIAMTAGSANAQVLYQATTSNSGNALNFGPDVTPNPPIGGGYWEMGNTITLAGSSSTYFVSSVDLTLYGGGDTSYPIQMDIYSGNNPNSGTLLGTYTAPAGFGTNTTVFDVGGLAVPGTITYILSLPDETGSYDSVFLYPILTSGAAPTIGSGPNSLWYGDPGTFVANNTYAISDGNSATTNYLQVEVNAPEGGASWLYLLLAGAVCFGAILFGSRDGLGSRTSA
jgi:hypothetical protein